MPPWTKTMSIVGDLLLLAVAYTIVTEAPHPLPISYALLLVASVAGGAVLSVFPFVLEYKASLALEETNTLRSTALQLQDLERLTQAVRIATSQWQTVQENCVKVVSVATEMGGKMVEEGKAFTEFMRKTNDAEKTHLRLEIDKMKRGENEWLEVLVRISDHVFALHKAGLKSGQPGLIDQLGMFQRAIRDTARRVGLAAHEATEDEPFDERVHQLLEPGQTAQPGTPILETIACGYSMQGQPIRRVVVALKQLPAASAQG
ncbi:MAG TPA: hypothetical protein DCM86_10565 [Verrucomicrobiales bacterium]|nr:hypothetical protein [Verrucomicrobiales bacterium]